MGSRVGLLVGGKEEMRPMVLSMCGLVTVPRVERVERVEGFWEC